MTTVDGNIETLSRAILGEAQAEIEELKGRSQSRADAILDRARAERGTSEGRHPREGAPGCSDG